MGLHANVMETELGLERLCTKCGDYWPEDREFWFIGNRKNQNKPCIQQPCKACYYELPSVVAKRAKRQRSYRI
jgi:hypothetical protein